MLVDSRIILTAVWRVVTGLQSGHQNLFSSPALFPSIIVLNLWAFLLSTMEHSTDSTKIRPFGARSSMNMELYTKQVLNSFPETRRSLAQGAMLTRWKNLEDISASCCSEPVLLLTTLETAWVTFHSTVLRQADIAIAVSSVVLLIRMQQKVKLVFKKLSQIYPLFSQHCSYEINVNLIWD